MHVHARDFGDTRRDGCADNFWRVRVYVAWFLIPQGLLTVSQISHSQSHTLLTDMWGVQKNFRSEVRLVSLISIYVK